MSALRSARMRWSLVVLFACGGISPHPVAPGVDGRTTVVILTGRNVAPKLLSEVLHS